MYSGIISLDLISENKYECNCPSTLHTSLFLSLSLGSRVSAGAYLSFHRIKANVNVLYIFQLPVIMAY